MSIYITVCKYCSQTILVHTDLFSGVSTVVHDGCYNPEEEEG